MLMLDFDVFCQIPLVFATVRTTGAGVRPHVAMSSKMAVEVTTVIARVRT